MNERREMYDDDDDDDDDDYQKDQDTRFTISLPSMPVWRVGQVAQQRLEQRQQSLADIVRQKLAPSPSGHDPPSGVEDCPVRCAHVLQHCWR